MSPVPACRSPAAWEWSWPSPAGSRLLGWWPCEEQCRGAGPFAASAIDRLDGFLTTMLGTRPGLDALGIEAQLPPEQADTATFAARWQRILERLLELERQDLRRLGATTGRTPLLIIRDATGERARFVGELPVAAIRDALTAPEHPGPPRRTGPDDQKSYDRSPAPDRPVVANAVVQ